MSILSDYKPLLVWKYFEEICAIPHGSGNEEKISEYIENFAISHGLKYVRDNANNVIIWVDKVGEDSGDEPVILQGHIDMVAQKNPDVDIDMDEDGLCLGIDGDELHANGTTLGGDDGVAVAYMLAILDDSTCSAPSIKHPPLECVFTTDEECGMTGAASLDMSLLKGRKMINLDSEDEGYLLVSCAGGVAVTVEIPGEKIRAGRKYTLKLVISGLKGGHSGCEIDKGRANADILMGRLLHKIFAGDKEAVLYNVNGGNKDNVIPSMSEAIIGVNNADEVKKVAEYMNEIFATEYKTTDADISVSVEEYTPCNSALSCASKVISALMCLPCGIQRMSYDIEGLPETSLSLGVMKTEGAEVFLTYLIRSSIEYSKENLVDRITEFASLIGANTSCEGNYPGWAYRKESPLRDLMFKTFVDMYGREPVVQAIHAGVECGMFANSITDFDAVSIGPDMKDIHTPNERLSISSTERVWNYLVEVLGRM